MQNLNNIVEIEEVNLHHNFEESLCISDKFVDAWYGLVVDG